MLASVRQTVTGALSNLEIQLDDGFNNNARNSLDDSETNIVSPSQKPIINKPAATLDPTDPSSWGKIPRNAPCPCESGRKYKHCHGKI